MKIYYLIIFSVLVLVTGALLIRILKTGNKVPEKTILFYSENCPYCQQVNEFIAKNKIKEKISIIEKEVKTNQENSRQLSNVAVSCNLGKEKILVPFLYVDKRCFVGAQDIINYLKGKFDLSQDEATAGAKL